MAASDGKTDPGWLRDIQRVVNRTVDGYIRVEGRVLDDNGKLADVWWVFDTNGGSVAFLTDPFEAMHTVRTWRAVDRRKARQDG
jgi:hypothetical protein